MDKRPLNFIKKKRLITTIITALLCLCILGNGNAISTVSAASNTITVDASTLVVGDDVSHVCSYFLATKYDSQHHWKECTLCGKKYDIEDHTLTDAGWTYGDNRCLSANVHTNKCSCGYSVTDTNNKAPHYYTDYYLTADEVEEIGEKGEITMKLRWRDTTLGYLPYDTDFTVTITKDMIYDEHWFDEGYDKKQNDDNIAFEYNGKKYYKNGRQIDYCTCWRNHYHCHCKICSNAPVLLSPWTTIPHTVNGKSIENNSDLACGETYTCDTCGATFTKNHQVLPESMYWVNNDGTVKSFTSIPITKENEWVTSPPNNVNKCRWCNKTIEELGIIHVHSLTENIDEDTMKNSMTYTMSSDIDMSTVSCAWAIHTPSVDFVAHTSDKGVIKNGQTVTNYEVFTNKKKYYSNASLYSSISWTASDGVPAGWAFYLFPSAFDGEAPTIDSLTSTDLKTNSKKNYATLRRYDFAGTENYGQTVNYTITDDTGKVFNSGLLQVNQDGDKSYTTSIQPAIEVAPGQSKIFTLKVIDQYKWETTKKFEVKNLDSRPPESKTDNTAKTWSKEKTYTATATEYGVGEVKIALNKDVDSNYVSATQNGNTYTQTYRFVGDATGGAVASVYYKDGLDNKSTYYLTVWNIDNTAPTLTASVVNNGAGVKIVANDYCSKIKAQGSGKTADGAGKYGFYYGYSTTNNVNTAKWTGLQTSDTYTFSSLTAGTYYFWVKDYVGNVSSSKSITSYPYEIHYYFQNINGTKYTEDTSLIATVKGIYFLDCEVTVPLPTVAGYKYSSMKIASGGKLSNGKVVITNENPANVAKKNVVSVYYNWDDGSGNTAKNLALVTFDSNKMKWHIDPGSNISASWKWTPTSTTNASADGFDSPENVQGYFVQRLYASEGSNITTGYGAFISRGQSEVKLSTIIDKYKGNGGGNNKNWGGDFPTVTATGCTFLGWNSKADGSGTWYSANGTGNKSGSDKNNTAVLVLDSTNKKYGLTVTLYAIWTDNAQVKASITYNQGVVNTATGIAGTASNLSPIFEQKSSTTVSTSGSIVTIPWSKDVQVNITGQDKATGNYLFYSKLIGADNSHKNQDAGTTTIYAAGLGEDSGTVNTLSNSTKRDSSANKAKTTSGAYTQNAGTYHLDYNIQGTYAVSVRNESRQYEEAIKNGVIQGDPAYKHLNNIFKIKIDNTAPVITSWRVTQDRLENYRSEDVEDAIAAGLYTTFKISFSDAHNSNKGAFLNQKDTSGIQGIYIRVWDKNDTSNVKVYSVPLENVSNKVLTDNEDEELFSGTVTYPINLYAEFPSASSVIYEAYVVDNAGNVTEKIGSVIIDSNKPLPDPDEGPEEPSDPDDPTPSPSPDYPSGTLTNFSIKTVIYNDMDEIFNIEDYVTYGAVSGDVGAFFQTGDVGHIDVWTIGYVTSVSPDFGSGAGDTMAEEAIQEIASGRLPSKYNMGLNSVGDYKRVWNYSQAKVLFPKYISYYDEDLHDMVTVYRSAGIKKSYSTKAYSAKEQQTYNSLVVHNGVPYAAHYTTKEDVISDDTKGWQSSGTKVRIPPYYKMKYPYSKSEKTNADGTTAYKTETHTYKATAYKNGDTDAASWIYMIYDTGSNDLHYRVIHENGVSGGSGTVEYYEELR